MDPETLSLPVADLARGAGAILSDHLGRLRHIEHKAASIDLVTEADRASEAFLVKGLTALDPAIGILAEEGGGHTGSSSYRWIVDPLDGTTNFAHGYPMFCVSVGLVGPDGPVLGVLYDPVRDELFQAIRGRGATRNGETLSVSAVTTLGDAMLVTGFPYDVHSSRRDNLTQFRVFLKRARAVRRGGSAALDLAYLASGRIDGFWEEGLAPWDMAAAVLVVTEAGGRVSGYLGEPLDLFAGNIVAAGPGIHGQMTRLLTEIEAGEGLPPLAIRARDPGLGGSPSGPGCR